MTTTRKGSKGPPVASGVSVETVASMCGLTPRRIQQLVTEGVIPRVGRGKYNLAACVRAYIVYLQQQLESAHADSMRSGNAVVNEERALSLRVQRELNQLKLEERKLSRPGSGFVSIETAAAEVARYQETIRTTLLAARSRYAGRVPIVALRELIDAIMRDLLRATEDFATNADEVSA